MVDKSLKTKHKVSFEEKLLIKILPDVEASVIRFIPDGKTVAYGAEKAAKEFIVVGDKKKGEEFDVAWDPVFSPDGKKVAFGAKKGNKLWWKVYNVEEE